MDLLRIARDRAVREVEERRRAETALQASEARYAQLSRKVLMAQEEERARLSRELHDELGQILTALRLEIGLLAKSMATPLGTKGELFGNAVILVENSTEELRRVCRGLRPPLLDDLGLEPALQTLTRDFAERTGISVDFDIDPEPNNDRVEPEVALAAYRIMQEALNNVSRHAETNSISASLFRTNEELQLSVEDHGVGFDPHALGPQNSCGLQGMRERAHLVDGTLSLVSSPGKGTRVVFRVPIKHGKGDPI
jgi:signal transduction histidine kinase